MADWTGEKINVRSEEACLPQPFLLWDTFWIQDPVTVLTAQGGFGDWGYSDPDEAGNLKGLRARAALHTATLLCLFTDRRSPDDMPIDGDDQRGWWGDGETVRFAADPFDQEMGSLLWTLERGTLSEQTAIIAEEMCYAALRVLIDQGIVARTEVEATALPWEGQLRIIVRHFSHEGATAYDQRFGIIWRQHAQHPDAQTLTRR